MTVAVQQPQRKDESEDYSRWGSLIGMGVGAYYGGPAGAAAGSSIGSAVGSAAAPKQANTQSIEGGNYAAKGPSSPLSRRQEAIQSDPATQMRQGKIAMASMDDQTRKAFEPVLDEGLRRAAQQRKDQYGYGYTGTQTA